MTVQSGIEAELPFLRAEAEATFQDTFAAYSPGGTTTNADGMQVPGFNTQGTTRGKVSGRSRESDTNTRTESVGGVERPVVEGGLHIPLSAPVPARGWEYQMTVAGPSTDPSLVGRRWRVVDAPAKSYATARRLDVVEVT